MRERTLRLRGRERYVAHIGSTKNIFINVGKHVRM
jgi:hypothetical protein